MRLCRLFHRTYGAVSMPLTSNLSPHSTMFLFDDNLDNVLISHSFERLFPLESYAERSFEPSGEIRTPSSGKGIFSLSAAGS